MFGAIGDAPRHNFQDAVRRFCRAFDDADRDGAARKDARQKKRQEWIDCFACRVGGEAHPAKKPYRFRKIEQSSVSYLGGHGDRIIKSAFLVRRQWPIENARYINDIGRSVSQLIDGYSAVDPDLYEAIG